MRKTPEIAAIPGLTASASAIASSKTQKTDHEQPAATPRTSGANTQFASAVVAIMELPLTDAEKAECIQRLMAR